MQAAPGTEARPFARHGARAVAADRAEAAIAQASGERSAAKKDAAASLATPDAATDEEQVFVTLTVADQLCGVPVLAVRDILGEQVITRIPLAPPEIAGHLHPKATAPTRAGGIMNAGDTAMAAGASSMRCATP